MNLRSISPFGAVLNRDLKTSEEKVESKRGSIAELEPSAEASSGGSSDKESSFTRIKKIIDLVKKSKQKNGPKHRVQKRAIGAYTEGKRLEKLWEGLGNGINKNI